MATLEGIIAKIKESNPEIQPVPQTVVKNTVTIQGLCMKTDTSNISPCIYIDKMILDSDISDEDAASQIVAIYNQTGIDIDPSVLTDREFVLNHLYVGLQRKDDECTYITRQSPWDEIIEYMYMRGQSKDGSSYSVKITEGLLKCTGIEENFAWGTAEKATLGEIKIQSLLDVFAGGVDSMELENVVPPFYVASNTSRVNGAAVALNQDFIREWALEHDYKKLVLIFSSIHEALLLPVEDETDLNIFNEMIQEVNSKQVDEVEQLADKAFIINL